MTTKEVKYSLQPATTLHIVPGHNYLIIFPKTAETENENNLAQLNRALLKLFEGSKVLALFADQVNDIKIAEVFRDEN
jgi:hypothetical protein